MRDDHLQGILFSKPQTVRFREVPLPPQSLLGKAKKKTKAHVLIPLTATFIRSRNKATSDNIAETGEYIEYAVIMQEK